MVLIDINNNDNNCVTIEASPFWLCQVLANASSLMAMATLARSRLRFPCWRWQLVITCVSFWLNVSNIRVRLCKVAAALLFVSSIVAENLCVLLQLAQEWPGIVINIGCGGDLCFLSSLSLSFVDINTQYSDNNTGDAYNGGSSNNSYTRTNKYKCIIYVSTLDKYKYIMLI